MRKRLFQFMSQKKNKVGNGFVDFSEGKLIMVLKKIKYFISADDIVEIYLCKMENPISHGDEEFHILKLQNVFWLVGPFINGSIGAIESLAASSAILTRDVTVGYLPWRFRESGIMGLRLFPVAGLGRFPLAEINELAITFL